MNFPALFAFRILHFLLLEASEAGFEVGRDVETFILRHLQFCNDCALLCIAMIFVLAHGATDVEAEEDKEDDQECNQDKRPVRHTETRVFQHPV